MLKFIGKRVLEMIGLFCAFIMNAQPAGIQNRFVVKPNVALEPNQRPIGQLGLEAPRPVQLGTTFLNHTPLRRTWFPSAGFASVGDILAEARPSTAFLLLIARTKLATLDSGSER